jgi:hypothetical protein
MIARLFEHIQAYIFAKADAEERQRRDEEAESINCGASAENLLLVRNTNLSWADIGLVMVKTWKETFRDGLEQIGFVKPRPVNRQRMTYVGDPYKSTKPIRDNIVTQRSTLAQEGEERTTTFYD